MTKADIISIIKKASDEEINQIATLMGWSPEGNGKKYFENKYLLRTAVENLLTQTHDKNMTFLDSIAVYHYLTQLKEEQFEVTRDMKINRINNCVKNNRGGIKLEDYNLSLHIKERKVSIVQENYVFIEDSIGDDDIDFEDMDDDEIDELHEIIDQVEIIDEKTMNRSEN